MDSYRDKVAVVTGAGSGIGRAIVDGLLARGALVVANDLDPEPLRSLAGDRVATVAADVSDPATAAELVAAASELGGGRIDALFNNAGTTLYKAAETYTAAEWDRLLAVNLSSCFYIASAVGRVMVEQGSGAILNTASVAGRHGIADNVAYVASKHGVVGLTRALAVEWARYGVRVNALSPGFTESGMTEDFKAQSPELYAERAARVPLGRAGRVEEQAAFALFLNSEEASYATGLVAEVDGGGHALYSGYKAPQPPSAELG